jgi:hypothetical protein
MLSYFLITWVVAFFALCLPLLFITAKEKEEERERSRGMLGFLLFKNPKTNFVLGSTWLLNLLFLIILPYIIGSDLNFTNFQILIGYLIISIVGGILTGGMLIPFYLFIPVFPGTFVVESVIGTRYK